jgi:hypothetical protein
MPLHHQRTVDPAIAVKLATELRSIFIIELLHKIENEQLLMGDHGHEVNALSVLPTVTMPIPQRVLDHRSNFVDASSACATLNP